MKNTLKKLSSVLFVLGLFAFGGSSALAATPAYMSASATNVTQTTATLTSSFNPQGLDTYAWFEMQNNPTVKLGYQNIGSTTADTNYHYLTNLTPGTTYTYRAVAKNSTTQPGVSSGTTWGGWQSFTTLGGGNNNPNPCNTNCNPNPCTSNCNPNPCTSCCNNNCNPTPTPAPAVNLNATPASIYAGGSVNLSWSSTNATYCSSTWGGSNTSGSMTVYPTSSRSYSITCFGNGGSATDTAYVTVNQIQHQTPTVNLSASPTSVQYGATTNLTWNVSNATSCVASNGWTGSKNANGGTQSIGNMTAGTTFSITCTGPGGSASDSVYVSVASQPVTNPTVTTNAPSGIGINYAVLNGTVSANGGSNVSAWFEWGVNTSMSNQTNQINYGSASNTNYSYSLGGLQPSTTYYYRAVAQNTNGQLVYGSQMSFTTQSNNTGCTFNCGGNNPSVTTYSATNISQNTATLNGYVETNGAYTARWFEYGLSYSNLYNQTDRLSQSNSGNFNQYLANLSPNTTYYFRAVAEGSNGKIYGNVLNFTTTGNINNNVCNFGNCAPTAITTLATNIDQNSARLNGLGLISGNVSTNGYFEYGETQSLGRTTVNNFIGNSPSSPFYSSLFGLSPNTTYYFRAVVTNQYGTSRGDILSFRTGGTGIVSGVSTNTNTVTRYVYREVIPVTNVITTTDVGVSKPSLVFLTINRNDEIANLGGTYEYLVNYKNVSGENLRDLVLRVVLPKELTYVNASRGYFSEENNTVVVNIANLYPQEEGSVAVRVSVNTNAEIGKTIVVTANMVYTIVNTNVQEEVFAYSKNTVGVNNSSVAGAALFGNGFFPTTLIGWLVLLLIILLIVLAIRMAYMRREVRVVDRSHINHSL